MTNAMPPPPKREPMSDAEKHMRGRGRTQWIESHTVWGPQLRCPWIATEFGARYTAVRSHDALRIVVWTTSRMFDGRFWAMRFVWIKARGQYELQRSTIRYRARRKDAKAICLSLLNDDD